MRLLSKEVFMTCRDGRPVFPGFVNYIDAHKPVLQHRYGWVDASDTYDDFADHFSFDNGVTWSEPVMKLQSHEVPEGRVRYAENAAFFDRNGGRLLTFCSRAFYPKGLSSADELFSIVWDVYDPGTGQWRGEQTIEHDLPGGLGISFCFPLQAASGTLLIPAMTMVLDEAGQPLHYRDCWAPMHASLTLQGHWQPDGSLRWVMGMPVHVDPEKSSRGYSENALAQLADGRLVVVLRGDNSMYPERPGYKWHCFSEDEGLTWSEPEPLGCSEGEPIESSSTGCALLRSHTDGRLYFIGNLALDGDRANGNWPRSPLIIAEVQEQPFALRRETITVIDRRAPDEPAQTQLSNFRFYQDRITGEIVVFLSRFGEKDLEQWKLADYYRYRIALD